MIEAAATWAEQNLEKKDPFFVKREDKTKDQILIDGNTAAALGSIYGGVSFAAWYPITPASSLADALEEYLPQLRCQDGGCKATYSIIQAEDELAAIGMALGAGWCGARAMTSTSGPGIALMAEFAGLALGCPTDGPQHWIANTYLAGGYPICPLPWGGRHQTHHATTWKYERVF
jgi:2-oxoglutarate ferredoxin oxidoreductase subunit alpha